MNVGFVRVLPASGFPVSGIRLPASARQILPRSETSRQIQILSRRSNLVCRSKEADSDIDDDGAEEIDDDDDDEGLSSNSSRTGKTSRNRSGFFASFWKKDDNEEDEEQEAKKNENKDEDQGFWKFWTGKEIDRDADVPGLEDLEIKWGEVLEPSVDNALALGLTGLLGLAVLQICWQLLLVTAAIIISGLKYTVLAAFLIAFVIFFL